MPTEFHSPAPVDRPDADAPTAADTHDRCPSRLALTGVTLAAALALTACSGDAEEPDDGGSGATEAAPSEESAEPTEEGSPSEDGSDDNSEDSAEETESSDDGDDAGGEYVPASADGPAQNVPEPEMPDAVSEKSETGVEATVEYFWEANWYLSVTGDPSIFEGVTAESCAFCQEEIDYFTTIYDEGSWYVTTPGEIGESSTSLDGDNSARAWMTLVDPPTSMYYSDGSEAGSTPGESEAGWEIQLEFSEDQWIVTGTTIVEGSEPSTSDGENG